MVFIRFWGKPKNLEPMLPSAGWSSAALLTGAGGVAAVGSSSSSSPPRGTSAVCRLRDVCTPRGDCSWRAPGAAPPAGWARAAWVGWKGEGALPACGSRCAAEVEARAMGTSHRPMLMRDAISADELFDNV